MSKNPAINPEFENPDVLSIEDRLVLYGFGLFETILVNQTGPCFLNLHYERMQKGAQILHLEMPGFAEWSARITNYIASREQSDLPFGLRVTLSGGKAQGKPGRFFLASRPLTYTPQQYSDGIALCLLSFPRNESSPLSQLKSANYLENLLAREEALSKGCQDGLWLNTKGDLCEGTLSNLFFACQGELFTPALNCGCLPGTRRRLILKLAGQMDIPCHEGYYSPRELRKADEVFVTNSLMGVMPVRQVGEYSYPVPPVNSSSLTRILGKGYQELVEKN